MTGVTLFSGIGCVEFGLSHLVNFIGAVEFDQAIADWHRVCHPGVEVVCDDVAAVDYRKWAGVDYLHASPSCKNASVANANGGEAEQDVSAAQAVCRAIREIRPKVFTLENVRGYAAFQCFGSILATLESEGYRYSFGIYDAADFGVPQNRTRLMLRAWRRSSPLPQIEETHGNSKEVAADTHQPKLFGESRLPWNGWYAAIEDLLPECPESKLAPWQVKRLPESLLDSVLIGGANRSQSFLDFALEHRKSVPGVKDAAMPKIGIAASSSSDIRAVLVRGDNATSNGPVFQYPDHPSESVVTSATSRAILVGTQGYAGQVQHIEADSPAFTPNTTSGAGAYRAIIGYNGESGELHREQERDAPALTADGSGKLRGIEGCRVVALTPRCLARFQTIPDSCPLPMKKSLATTMIGNAVPSDFARAIFGPTLEAAR